MKRRLLILLGLSPLAMIAACSRPHEQDEVADEVKVREAYAENLLRASDAGKTLYVTSTSEIQFGAGFGALSSNPVDEFRSNPFRWMGAMAHVRLKSHGARPMKIVIAGWIHEKMVQTHPSMDVFIDNYFVKASPQFDDSHFWFDFVTPDWVFQRDWVDMTIRLTSVGFHWDAPPALKTVVLYRFEYKEAD